MLLFSLLAMLTAAPQTFEVHGVLRQVDPAERRIVLSAGGKEHGLRVPEAVKVIDADGKPLIEGLRSKGLTAGTRIALVGNRDGQQRVLLEIRIEGKSDALAVAPARPAAAPGTLPSKEAAVPQQDTSKLVPLVDLGQGTYQGFSGGLYTDGKNDRPPRHEAAGLKLAAQVQPLGADGKPSRDGRIVLLGIGFSNTVQAFHGFMEVAERDPEINPKLLLVNGAVGGMSAAMIQDPDDGKRGTQYWNTVDDRLKAGGATRAQVQVIWIKETDPAPHEGSFPGYIRTLESELTRIVQVLPARFPNVKLAYLSSRTYGGWAKFRPDGKAPGNSEPYSYESGFAVKWLIARQIDGEAALNFDPARGAVKAPWLSWSAYLWTNGTKPRRDGLYFQLEDFQEKDRMHESPAGQQKVGKQLVQFFKSDTTAKPWFVRR
jgi:hypothetical protein